MRWSRRSLAVVAAMASFNGAACEIGHDCTDIGCADSVSVRVTTLDQPWPEGDYQLEVTLDDLSGVCEFSLPNDLPARGSVTSIRCLEGVEIGIEQLYECVTLREGDGVSQSCEPIPDRHEVTLRAYGTPAQLSLTLTLDDSQLLDKSRTLTYAVMRPNGPECEPECRQAEVELTFE